MSRLVAGLRSFKEAFNDKPFSYYEYKYLVPHENLNTVRHVLEELYGGSDPYSEGVVDSIYYDTSDEICLAQCLNGDARKTKFRIRGYGNGSYVQVHQKLKDLYGVSKHKSKIVKVKKKVESAPNWDSLFPDTKDLSSFNSIKFNSESVGPLFPSIQVKYHRHRYRTFDFRMTLDTNIEVSSLSNGIPRSITNDIFPFHVLEIKTMQTRPKLPFIGIVKLRQVSFSKFMIGIHRLNNI